MYKFFDPDGLFAKIMNTVLALIVLNVLWIVCSLPVVTMGASTAALYTVLIGLRDGNDTKVIRRFFAAFGENWKQASAVWLVLLAASAVCGLDLYLAAQTQSTVARVACVVGLVAVAMTATFAFPLLARFENTWRNHLKNGALLALSHAPRTLLSLALWGGAAVLTVYSFATMYHMILLWLMLGFSCLSYATLWVVTPVLRKLEPAPAEEKEEV